MVREAERAARSRLGDRSILVAPPRVPSTLGSLDASVPP
jgi:hypothetical protein